MNKIDILGVGITKASEDEILEYILNKLRWRGKNKEKILIFTPNPEQISAAARNQSLKNLLNQAQIALPDGVGVVIAARLLGKPVYARITGVDFMEKLVKSVARLPKPGTDGQAEQPVITGYLGGEGDIAETTAKCLIKRYPGLAVGYASATFDKTKMIHSDIDILFVALGFPKQEKWILEHKDEIPATVIMAVGGALDFISGNLPRAPKFLRQAGLEWLFRLALQPWRFWRQARLLQFSGLILREALSDRLKKLRDVRSTNSG